MLTADEKKLAVRNALRYFPAGWHAELAPEFWAELAAHGRIYKHRFRPAYAVRAFHLHAVEQTGEVERSLAHLGARLVEWLLK